MADRPMDSFCSMLADLMAQTRAEIHVLIRRAVGLEDRLARLEGRPDSDPGEIDRLRADLAAVDGQLVGAQDRLRLVENEYNFARNPVLG